MAATDWIDREPGMVAALHELTRVLRRARRRWLVTVLLAAGVTGLLVAKLARKQQLYRARAILRMTEGAFTDTRNFLGRGDLEGYLWNVVLAKQTVYPVIQELGLYPDLQELGETAALEELRSDLDVAVFRNFFLIAGSEERRSVRVALTYTSPNPKLSIAVVERLADLVIDYERQRQIRITEAMEAEALRALEEADTEIAVRERRLAEIALALTRDRPRARSELQVEQTRLQMEMQSYNAVLSDARDKLSAAKAFLASPQSTEIAQMRLPEEIPAAVRQRRLIIVGALGFTVLLPLTAIFIGAFDTRVRNSEDVERIGLPVIGHVPAFRGYTSGALAERLPKRRFWRRLRLSAPDRTT